MILFKIVKEPKPGYSNNGNHNVSTTLPKLIIGLNRLFDHETGHTFYMQIESENIHIHIQFHIVRVGSGTNSWPCQIIIKDWANQYLVV